MDEQQARLRDLARVFLKIGAMSYGGPAIVGIMQNEIQERRRWLGKERFVEGLSIVNMLPGPGATQLAIFIGHTKGGLAGGIVAGICFIIPAFAIMLLLASAYAAFGALPALRNAFYGIGPVVVGIFAVVIYRLAKGTIKDRLQIPIAVSAVGLVLFSPFGLAVILLAAGCAGVTLFHSWRTGLAALLILALALAGAYAAEGFIVGSALPVATPGPQSAVGPATLWDVGAFFFKVGTFTFGGGLSMLAFMQEQVVNQFGWLTPQISLVLDKYYWFHERHWHLFGLTQIAGFFAGTPLKNIFSRLEGVKMGKKVFDDGIRWTEYSLLDIGDYANFNALSILWPHSLEEGVFKSDRIKVGKGCTLCSGSLTHYGVTMGDHVVLDVNAYLMKGEIMDPYTTWRGNPARAVGDRVLSGADQETSEVFVPAKVA